MVISFLLGSLISKESVFKRSIPEIIKFKLLPDPVHIDTNDIYQSFVETDQNLSIIKELHWNIVSQL